MKLLVVAASSWELAGITCPLTRVVGVGKLQAAVYTYRAIESEKPDLVVCVGTARALDPSLRIGDIVTATSVWQHDVDLTRFGLLSGELPNGRGGVVGEIACHPFPGLPAGRCASGDVFVTRPYQESHPQLSGSLFCDMESYGIAFAAKELDTGIMIVRSISDDSCGHRPKRYHAFIRKANEQLDHLLSHIAE
ncbi:MAG: 5'-methylthioadenosine/S-adenosylhomocysteine nucleosidase [Sphaerochaetaceae bacterium]|nr:5'-methylthioadenosine/S-adenosylhomocysteine nucleosidase [Spirochaetales bacterium]MDY5499779.1 5'-methylthioadenosine/S-adenosylhomocysteine nucleosidase [Sphaerochaetaceae bacterium]